MNLELENITYKEYLNLEDRHIYNYAHLYSRKLNEGKDIFGFGDFTKLTFGQVKDMQYNFSKGLTWQRLFEAVKDIKGVAIERIVEYKYFDLCRFMAFVYDETDKIQELEEHLTYEVSEKDEAAGINELAPFGIALQVDSLALGNVQEYENVKAVKYDTCFLKLLMEKKKANYKYNFNKIKK